MTVEIVRKPPSNKAFVDRFQVELSGIHTIEQKICMARQCKYHLMFNEGIPAAGVTHFYMQLLDSDGHPLIAFRDGRTFADYKMLIREPYDCAADYYEKKSTPPMLRL